MDRTTDTTVNTTNGINLIAGLWLVIAPFVLNFSLRGVSPVNDVVLGIAIGILALIQMTNHEISWPAWLNLVAALWLVISPFALGYTDVSQYVWNNIVVGVIVGALAITSGASTSIENPV